MGARKAAWSALIGIAVLGAASAPAAAQSVTFSTSGAFGGASCGPTLCAFGNYVLRYISVGSTSWTPPGEVSLGQFGVTCLYAPCDGSAILAGSTFMLTVTQTAGAPTGSASFTGSLGWNSTTSTLSWVPTQGSVTIGGVTYALNEDATGCAGNAAQCVNIGATPNVNYVPTFTDVRDDVTTTPEPATVALMATGLVGLIPVARRRRRAQSE